MARYGIPARYVCLFIYITLVQIALGQTTLTSLFSKSTYETMATSRVETKEHL